ncbi:MFS transporter, partial [Pseudonocardia sp.]|uniref:MFS transporter n=1 Tax=Pseudonocardia sp. TaxID=60912 RepID=UPI0026294152
MPGDNREALLAAMADPRDTRLRAGRTGWALNRDARDETAFVEQYTVASREEHHHDLVDVLVQA